jgi:hypothetical protein
LSFQSSALVKTTRADFPSLLLQVEEARPSILRSPEADMTARTITCSIAPLRAGRIVTFGGDLTIRSAVPHRLGWIGSNLRGAGKPFDHNSLAPQVAEAEEHRRVNIRRFLNGNEYVQRT